MTTFIKAKLRKSYDQTNIKKHRVATNIKEYHITSTLIIRRIMVIRKLFLVKKGKKSTRFESTYGLFGYNYRVATLLHSILLGKISCV